MESNGWLILACNAINAVEVMSPLALKHSAVATPSMDPFSNMQLHRRDIVSKNFAKFAFFGPFGDHGMAPKCCKWLEGRSRVI